VKCIKPNWHGAGECAPERQRLNAALAKRLKAEVYEKNAKPDSLPLLFFAAFASYCG